MQRGILAAHLVRGEWRVESSASRGDHVEVWARRLDHEHVRAFFEVGGDLGKGLASVARIHLVSRAVPKPRGAIRGGAERTVEGGRVLRRVREDRGFGRTGGVELVTDRGDA